MLTEVRRNNKRNKQNIQIKYIYMYLLIRDPIILNNYLFSFRFILGSYVFKLKSYLIFI